MTEDKVDILIADEDSVAGELAKELLEEGGFSVHLLTNPADTLIEVRQRTPKLLILDIVAGKVNAFKICKAIKSSPQLQRTKIAILSQKFYESEKQQAFRLGVDGFIKKPFNVKTFASQIRHILEESSKNIVMQRAAPEQDDEMLKNAEKGKTVPGKIKIRIWGSRSLDKMIPNSECSGGRQTPCVSIETDKDFFILDAGTGIIPLGHEIVESGWPKEMWILLSHLHLGHIIGLPQFPCIYSPYSVVRIAGPAAAEKKFKEMVTNILYASPFWRTRHPKARIYIYEVLEDTYDLTENVKLSTIHANHPSSTLCMALHMRGNKIVFAPANEISGEESAMENFQEKFIEFCKDADVIIHDSYYSDSDYKFNTQKGHSCPENVLEMLAKEVNPKHLILFNVNGAYSQEELELMSKKTKRLAQNLELNTNCHMAEENFELTLMEKTKIEPLEEEESLEEEAVTEEN
jgi:CheY-like chemotaxis protein